MSFPAFFDTNVLYGALVTGYDDLVPTMTNDEKDRHVLAAAVRGGAEVLALVELVDGYDSPAMTVDDFLLALTRAGVPKFVDAARSKLY